MGLKSDIMEAKKKAILAQGIPVNEALFTPGSPNEIEARYMTEAIVNFLTHDDLHFTISKLKASVELEEFNLSEDLDADVKTKKVINDKLGNLYYMKLIADIFISMLEDIHDIEIPVVGITVGKVLPPLGILIKAYKEFWKTTEKQITEKTPQIEGKGDIRQPAPEYRKDGGKHH